VADDKPTKTYAGQQMRPIKALSKEDIGALREGEGMGMAKTSAMKQRRPAA
jgi:hypothetical protein